MLDEMECSIHNSLSIVKRTLESNMVVAGGGAAEAALSVYLENLATTLGSRGAASCCWICLGSSHNLKGNLAFWSQFEYFLRCLVLSMTSWGSINLAVFSSSWEWRFLCSYEKCFLKSHLFCYLWVEWQTIICCWKTVFAKSLPSVEMQWFDFSPNLSLFCKSTKEAYIGVNWQGSLVLCSLEG